MIRKAIDKLLSHTLYRPLPPIRLDALTPQEDALIRELRNSFEDIPEMPTDGPTPEGNIWARNMNRLRELILTTDPRKFLEWDVIGFTMFVRNAAYIRKEFSYLKGRQDYRKRWKPALQENPSGSPILYRNLAGSSGNLVHHAYHLAIFEETTGTPATDADLVFEFGGGYGSMCRLFYNLGFNGKYLIFDLPAFSALQKYYLQSIGLKVLSAGEFTMADRGICCISDPGQLSSILKDDHNSRLKSLFLATWSVSEAPVSLRKSTFDLLQDFSLFLIGYQHKFYGVDNVAYFNGLVQEFDHVKWDSWPILHLPQDSYLIGRAAGRKTGKAGV